MSTVEQLEYTSERVNPTWYRQSPGEYLIYLFHVATYRFAEPYAKDRQVLDYGCGTGYGSAMLAESAANVTAIDVAADVTEHNSRQYADVPNLEFLHVPPAEVGPLPFADESFDTVVSFQVIEHVRDVDAYLGEIRRVLRPGGQFIAATPDRSTRLFPGQKPWNRHHVTEYSGPQLTNCLAQHFEATELFGMTGDPTVLSIELKRTQRTKWMLLPLTLPLMPESLRCKGLAIAKSIDEAMRQRSASPHEPTDASTGTAPDFGFDESAIRIGPHVAGCVNLVSVSRKGKAAQTGIC